MTGVTLSAAAVWALVSESYCWSYAASGLDFHRLGSELGFRAPGPCLIHRLGSELGFSAAGPVFRRLGWSWWLVFGAAGPVFHRLGWSRWLVFRSAGPVFWASGLGLPQVGAGGQTNPLGFRGAGGFRRDSRRPPAGWVHHHGKKVFFLMYIGN